jgi:hypothetical protein
MAEHAMVTQSYVSLEWFDLFVIGDEKYTDNYRCVHHYPANPACDIVRPIWSYGQNDPRFKEQGKSGNGTE